MIFPFFHEVGFTFHTISGKIQNCRLRDLILQAAAHTTLRSDFGKIK